MAERPNDFGGGGARRGQRADNERTRARDVRRYAEETHQARGEHRRASAEVAAGLQQPRRIEDELRRSADHLRRRGEGDTVRRDGARPPDWDAR